RDTYDCRKPFRGWIWTIHVNACRRLARKQWSRQESPGDDKVPEPASPEAPVGDGLERDEQNLKVVETLTLIPEEQAEAIRMRFFGELSFEEIGAAMDCSAATAKSRVRYGLAKMAK